MNLTVTRRRDGDTVTLTAVGHIGLAARDLLTTAIVAAIDESVSEVAVDLVGVTFLDSIGIGALIRGRALAEERGMVFYIVGASGQVREVLELSGVWERLIR